MSTQSTTERLDSFEETKVMLGFRSRTSVYAAIKNDPDFPKPVRRGRSVFFFRSESLAYLEKLRIKRGAEGSDECANQISARMLAGKHRKLRAAQQRKAGEIHA